MRVVVITTINCPTAAVEQWRKIGDRLVVVGDRKTPPDWALDGAEYLPADAQRGALAAALPWDHYCRKNLGYVEAIRAGASVIVDTDDDNAPKADWSVPTFDAPYEVVGGESPFVNVYGLFNPSPGDLIWPRGYPLDQILAPPHVEWTPRAEDVKVGIWQGLADGDPDVDAIYRLARSTDAVRFQRTTPLVLARGSTCPFNSQSTVFRREVFPLLYLPAVSFRFTDILRAIVAQPILWAAGYRLGFTGATVVQKRNCHDLMSDFGSEIPMYLHATTASRIVVDVVRDDLNVPANMLMAYGALEARGVVDGGELLRLASWLRTIEQAAR